MVATKVKIAGKMLFNLNGGDPSQVEAASEATLVSWQRKTANGGRCLMRFSQRLVLGLRNYNHIYYYYTYQ